MEWVFLWFGLSVVIGIVAGSKGRMGFGYFILSLILSPLLIGILVLALPSVKRDPNAPNPSTHVRCPDCRELVLKDARKCKHCGSALVPQQ